MGKQINYWAGYDDFLKIAQAALDCGCIIIKKSKGELLYGQTLDIITEHEYSYWFYVPAAGTLYGKKFPFDNDDIPNYSLAGNTVIQASFSKKNDKTKIITRGRLFVISGYYDEQDEYISRPECVTKIYNKLVGIVKKIAPYTVLIDKYVSTKDDTYLKELEWRHKEYISPEYLDLKECKDYKLTV